MNSIVITCLVLSGLGMLGMLANMVIWCRLSRARAQGKRMEASVRLRIVTLLAALLTVVPSICSGIFRDDPRSDPQKDALAEWNCPQWHDLGNGIYLVPAIRARTLDGQIFELERYPAILDRLLHQHPELEIVSVTSMSGVRGYGRDSDYMMVVTRPKRK